MPKRSHTLHPLAPAPGRWQAVRAPLAAALALLAAATAVAWLTYVVSLQAAVQDLQDSAVRRLDTAALALASALDRFNYLPALLETTPAVMALLAQPGDPVLRDHANRTLVRINAIAGADMLFVLDPKGNAQAAADWDQPITTVGHNYSYRPYMQGAMATGRGRFFGVGATSRVPGYFLSYALRHDGQVLGVATVKISLEAAERVWSKLPGAMLVTDERGVVILTSRPEWKFHAWQPLSAQAHAEVLAQKPYAADPPLLPWATADGAARTGQHVLVGDAEHLVTTHALPQQRWQMQALDPVLPAQAKARNQAWMAGLASAVAGLLAMAALQSRHATLNKLAAQAALQAAHDTLESRVAERTQQLSGANTALATEVEHRKAVEQSLRNTQHELVHTAKMAVLGQISAGLAHELNQPLAALRTLSDNAVVLMDKQRLDETRGNLQRISHLVGRLGELTRRLKTFAHKPGDQPVATPLAAAVANVQALLAERLRRQGVQMEVDIAPDTLCALADPGLIEQVLVNLMVNAVDAMAGMPQRRLRVQARAQGTQIHLAVSDSGAGILPQMLPHLFEPFATSKPPGAGLGLGLMISRRIVREFGGELSAAQNDEGGATFVMTLPAANAPASRSGALPAST
jgi:two-component system C4-dicarboxylate transport sensor histidine kinase DctB